MESARLQSTDGQMKYRTGFFLLTLWMAAAGIAILASGIPAQAAQSYDYSAIDRHALSAPAEAERSVADLAAYLTKTARNDREKARAIFRWVTANISYDTRVLNGTAPPISDDPNENAERVLKTRGAACAGYAQVFERLATKAGLNAVVIDGYAKGLGYSAGSPMTQANSHEWNAIKTDGNWLLVDCAWGAGAIDRSQYVSDFDDHFFLTPPEEFIYDHWPNDPKWQLIDKPISRDQFEAMPVVRSPFFRNGMKLTNTSASIQVDDSFVMSISAPADVLILPRLIQSGRTEKSLAIGQREDGDYKIYAALPRAGTYLLQVYVKRADDPGQYALALSYQVQAVKGAGDGVGFPEILAAFSEGNGRIYRPMAGRLKAGSLYPFRIKVPGAEQVAVIIGNEWVQLTKKNDTFEGRVTPESGKVKVAAKYPGDSNFAVLLEYQADERGTHLPAALAITE